MFRFAPPKCYYTIIRSHTPTACFLFIRASTINYHQTLPSQSFRNLSALAMGKRKSQAATADGTTFTIAPIQIPTFEDPTPPAKRRASRRKVSQPQPNTGSTNPNKNANVLDAPEAFRASPDASEVDERIDLAAAGLDVNNQMKEEEDDSPLSEMSEVEPPVETKKAKPKAPKARALPSSKNANTTDAKAKLAIPLKDKKESAIEPRFLDPEAEGDEEADEEEIQAALCRPPPVHSGYLPLPWKGRLGYVRLNHPKK
jgi:UV DNA damage endonuclease